MNFPHGKTVTLVTRSVTGQDAFGNDVYTESSSDVAQVPVWPRGATELVQGQDTTITGLSALLPEWTNVAAIDAVIVDGNRYEVDGEPGRFESPFTGLNPGVLVNLSRVAG